MSFVPGEKSDNPYIHFTSGIKDLLRFDKVRLINIGGSIQYGIIYSILYFIIGIALHVIFPPLIKNDPLFNIFLWIVLQSIVLIIITFYVQKFVQAIPGVFSYFPEYFNIRDLTTKGLVPYGLNEYKGDMASSIILIGTQMRLLEKIAFLTTEVAKKYL
jgi:hypothetical protein